MTEHPEAHDPRQGPASVTSAFHQVEDKLAADVRETYNAEAGLREIIRRAAEPLAAEVAGQALARNVSVGQAARMMHVSRATIRELIRGGDLEAIRVGWSLRIPEDAIRAHITVADGPAREAEDGNARSRRFLKASVLAAGAIFGITTTAMARKRLKERDEIARAAGVPVLASLRVLHPAGPAGWRSLLDDYRPEAVDAWKLHKALRELEVVIAAPLGAFSLTVLTLSSDTGALALGPQLAAFAASLGVRTTLVVGPGPDNTAMAGLRAACAAEPPGQRPNLRTVNSKAGAGERQERKADELTIVVTVVNADDGAGQETIRATTATVLGVSAGAATAEQLATVVAVGGSQTFAGILVADPASTDRTTGRIASWAAASRHRQPTQMSGNTAQAIRSLS